MQAEQETGQCTCKGAHGVGTVANVYDGALARVRELL